MVKKEKSNVARDVDVTRRIWGVQVLAYALTCVLIVNKYKHS